MKVKIIQSEKNPRELEIYLDDELYKSVSKYLFKRHLSALKHVSDFPTAFALLEEKISYQFGLALLSKKAYTTFELRNKLTDKFSPPAIDHCLLKLKPYLRDEELIKSLILKEIQAGSGLRKILLKAKKRSGFPHEILKSWIEDSFPHELQLEKARKLLATKMKGQDPKSRQRAFRFLLSRGFSYDIAFAVIS